MISGKVFRDYQELNDVISIEKSMYLYKILHSLWNGLFGEYSLLTAKATTIIGVSFSCIRVQRNNVIQTNFKIINEICLIHLKIIC